MDAWAGLWALRLGMAATCLILVVGLALGIRPETMVLRSVVVGGVLYGGLRVLGGLVGVVLLRLAVEHTLAKQDERRNAMAEDDLEMPGKDGKGGMNKMDDGQVDNGVHQGGIATAAQETSASARTGDAVATEQAENRSEPEKAAA